MKRAFTLLELLVVISIIGVLTALVAPSVSHFKRGDANAACANSVVHGFSFARQYAITHRTDVYAVFSTNSFELWTSRTTGDQPGVNNPTFIERVTLPEGTFFAPWKFINRNPVFPNYINVGGSGLNVWGFPRLKNELGTKYNRQPFIQWDSTGKMVSDKTNTFSIFNNVVQISADIPLAAGSVLVKSNTVVSVTENPNSTNAWRFVHIDYLTGIPSLNEKPMK